MTHTFAQTPCNCHGMSLSDPFRQSKTIFSSDGKTTNLINPRFLLNSLYAIQVISSVPIHIYIYIYLVLYWYTQYCPFLLLDMLELLDISMTLGYASENLTTC